MLYGESLSVATTEIEALALPTSPFTKSDRTSRSRFRLGAACTKKTQPPRDARRATLASSGKLFQGFEGRVGASAVRARGSSGGALGSSKARPATVHPLRDSVLRRAEKPR